MKENRKSVTIKRKKSASCVEGIMIKIGRDGDPLSFGFSTLARLISACEMENYDLKFSEELSVLAAPFQAGGQTIKNRFCVHPMEGSDALADGSPSELTIERYRRFARGGSGLIWFEAVSVLPEARASASQLMLTPANLQAFQRLAAMIKEDGLRANGFAPVVLMQLTHSGRFSKPFGSPQPIIAYHNSEIDLRHNINPGLPVVSDDYLAALPAHFVKTALLAQEAGFDGVDVKCCHRYLLSELLSAFERTGPYGGSFENRTRLYIDCVDAIRKMVDENFIVGTRLNGFDALPAGFACGKPDYMQPDLTETLALVRLLKVNGVDIFNITTGSPYYNSYVNRPNDVEKTEPPLLGVARMFGVIGEIQKELGTTPVVGTGYSYLREFIPYAAAGEILAGRCTSVGLGRMSFARPDYPKEVLNNSLPPPKKLCITCGKCAQLLRAGGPSYCAIYDNKKVNDKIQRGDLK